MSSKQKSSQTSKPSLQALTAGNALLAQFLGPQARNFIPTKGNPLGTGFNTSGIFTQPGGTLGTVFDTASGGPREAGGLPSGLNIPNNTTIGGGGRIGANLLGGSPFDSVASAGNIPGTALPNLGLLQNIAGNTFFGGLAEGQQEGNINPIFGGALDAISSARQNLDSFINFGTSGGGGGGLIDAGSLPTNFGDRLITKEQSDQAVEGLLNTPSVFDELGSGGISDIVAQQTSEFENAQRVRAEKAIDELSERALADIAAQNGGLISSSDVLRTREAIASNVITETEVALQQNSLLNTRFLGELAIQDIALGSKNMEAVLQGALQEKGINASFASAIANANAEIIKSREANRLNAAIAASQLAQGAAVDLLQLGLSDFNNAQSNFLNQANVPTQGLLSLATGFPGISSGSSSSKSV